MAEAIQTEVLRRVHTEDGFIEVGEWPDSPDHLELRTHGKSAEFFGKINLLLAPKIALELGRALVQTATEKGAV